MPPPPGSISGRQIRAARALVSVSQSVLAEAAGVSLGTLKRMEANSINIPSDGLPCKVTSVRQALERFGALCFPDDGVAGAGVRLKFTRPDTRQLGRWEDEGGSVGDDDLQ